MHLQQTKRASRATGGPQYYFHDLTEPVKVYLREKGVVQVALITPYGATKSHFFAVSRDRKLGSCITNWLIARSRLLFVESPTR